MIGCRLPNGIYLDVGDKTVKLNGLNSSEIAIPYATTSVDEGFWKEWYEKHGQFPAVLSGAIFVAQNHKELAAKAAEVKKEKTGLERLNPNEHGVKDATVGDD
jgi:hypothetical protein